MKAARNAARLGAGLVIVALATPASSQTGAATIPIPPRPQATPPAPPANPVTPRGGSRRAEIMVPLKERDFYLGDVLAMVDTTGGVDLPRDRVATLLAPLVSPTAQQRLNALPERITIVDLQSLGLEARFDPNLLEIVVVVPADDKQRRAVEIFDRDRFDRGQFERPTRFSGWLTWRSSLDYVHKGSDEGLASPFVSFNSGLRFPGGWVLDNEATLDTDPDAPRNFTRQVTRFSFDEPEKARRWEIGDLAPVVRGFQASPDMAGFSLLKSYQDLQPSRNIRPRGQGAFTLRDAGVVDVFVNGRLVRRLELDSGNYDVSDFPFTVGRNDVEFVVEDRTGRRELLRLDRYYDQSLLEPGLSEYQLAVGVAAPLRDGEPRYDTDSPIVTGYYRRGLTETLTLGANLQVDKDGGMVGGEGLWASPFGLIGAGAAVSAGDDRNGWAVQADYSLETNREVKEGRYSLGAYFEARSRKFAATSDFGGGENTVAAEAGLYYTRDLNEKTALNLDLGYLWARGEEDNRGRGRVGLSRRLTNATSISIDVEYDQGRANDRSEVGAFFTLNHRFGINSYARVTQDTAEERTRLSYQQSPARPNDGWSLSADLDRSDGETAFNGTAYRSWNRIETSLTHLATYDEKGSEITQQRTALRMAGSIAFAGGRLAVGRPIYDGFAIVKAHETLKGSTLRVDPGKEGELARSDLLGAALITDLSAYSRRTVTIGVDRLPTGYDIGKGSFDLLPPNRAGYVLVVGSAYSVTVIGALLDVDGKPVALALAKAYHLSEPTREPVTLFTNRTGRFAAQGLKAGAWRIEAGEGGRLVYDLKIGEGETLVRMTEPLRPKGAVN